MNEDILYEVILWNRKWNGNSMDNKRVLYYKSTDKAAAVDVELSWKEKFDGRPNFKIECREIKKQLTTLSPMI